MYLPPSSIEISPVRMPLTETSRSSGAFPAVAGLPLILTVGCHERMRRGLPEAGVEPDDLGPASCQARHRLAGRGLATGVLMK